MASFRRVTARSRSSDREGSASQPHRTAAERDHRARREHGAADRQRLPGDDGAREPRDRRVADPASFQASSSRRCCRAAAAAADARQARRHALGRPAPDARGRTGADVRSAACSSSTSPRRASRRRSRTRSSPRSKSINALGVSILMVEQKARQCLAIADYGYVLEQGRNRLEGAARSTPRRSRGGVALSRRRVRMPARAIAGDDGRIVRDGVADINADAPTLADRRRGVHGRHRAAPHRRKWRGQSAILPRNARRGPTGSTALRGGRQISVATHALALCLRSIRRGSSSAMAPERPRLRLDLTGRARRRRGSASGSSSSASSISTDWARAAAVRPARRIASSVELPRQSRAGLRHRASRSCCRTWATGSSSTTAASRGVEAGQFRQHYWLDYESDAAAARSLLSRRRAACATSLVTAADLLGRAPMPPRWALAICSRHAISRRGRGLRACRRRSGRSICLAMRSSCSRATATRRAGTAASVASTRHPGLAPDPDALIADLRAQGFHAITHEYPVLHPDSPLYAEAEAKGFLLDDAYPTRR